MTPLILLVSILLQIIAAILALRPISRFGSKIPWRFLSAAILLMAVRRSITFAHILAGNNAKPPDAIAESVALLISILMLMGIALLHRMSRQSANNFEQISQAMQEAMAVITPSGEFLYTNKEAANRLSSGTLDNLTGRSIAEFVSSEQAQYLIDRYRQISDSGTPSVDEVIITVDGEERWFHNSLEPIRYGSTEDPAVLSISLDITERKHYETESRLKDTRLRQMGTMLDMAPASITVHSKSGKFLYANQASSSIHGYTHEEFMALPLSELDSKESAAVYKERVVLLEREGEANFEVTHQRKDGSLFPLKVFARYVDWGGEEVILSVAADITERKQAEDALRESEQRLQSVFNAVDGVPIQGYDKDRRVIFWNPASEKLYGYSREEALGQKLEDLIIPEAARGEVVDLVRKWHDEGAPIPAGEIELRHKNGDSLHVYSNHVMITNRYGEKEMFCIDVNLTEMRKIEQRMASFSAVVENSDNIVVVKDLDLRVVATNQAFANAAGHDTVETMIGKTDAEIFGVSPNTEPVRSYMEDERRAQTLPRGESLLCEEPVITPGGEVRTFLTKKYPIYNESGALIGTGNISTDITKRKQAEEALRASEARYRCLAENFPNGALTLFDKDLRYISASGRELGEIGLREKDIVGKTMQEVFPEVVEIIAPNCRAAFAGESRECEVTYKGQQYSNTIIPVRNDDGEIQYGFAITQNITENKRMQERLRQMEKMDAIGQLAGGVAHDFNNQLSGIIGYGDMLLGKLHEPKLKRYVEYMLIGAKRSAELTRQLLAFARKDEQHHIPTDLHAIIHEVVAIMERSINKNIAIRKHLDASKRTISGDPTQIQNAILNLGINARDAMPEGGEIFFETRNVSMTPEDCANMPYMLAPGSYLELRVIDTGCGMSEEVKQRIFEPFFSTKETGKGTGMGLASVYGTVTHHKGAINVYSEPGDGTSFVLQFPLTGKAVTNHPERNVNPASLQGKRILVIDDEILLRDMTAEMLSSLDCYAHTEPDGAAGLAYYRDHWREIDAVVLDMIMPNMAGRETFLAIREINPDARVLIASGFSAGGGARELLEQGAVGFLQKPFQQSELIERLIGAIT